MWSMECPSKNGDCLAARNRSQACKSASLRGAFATKQSIFLFSVRWIASRSLSSGAHSRDPLARNDVGLQAGW